jgi:hypothetical protein
MKNKKRGESRLAQQETRLIDGAAPWAPADHGLGARHSRNCQEPGRPLKTAGEVEELLIEEMRRLGGATLRH